MRATRRPHRHLAGWIRVAATIPWLLLGCGSTDPSTAPRIVDPTPVVVIPPGVETWQTADIVIARTIRAIRRDEQTLRRDLGPIRILHVESVAAGRTYWTDQSGGSNPGGMSFEAGERFWVVEALGTFVDDRRGPHPHRDIGRHGFYLWGDDGTQVRDLDPCWSSLPGHELTETCDGRALP